MPVTSVTQDPVGLTITVVAEFQATAQRLWDAFVDPRQLERFWGPPTHPAQFTRHDVAPGGLSAYAISGPDGMVSRGYWRWLSVEPQRSFEVLDGFAHADGSPNAGLPSTRTTYLFETMGAGSRMTTTTWLDTADDLALLIEMGMQEGLRQSMNQMDHVLADLRSFAADLPTSVQILSATQVRISRVVSGPSEAVWRAFHEKTLLQKWLAPDGQSMPVCEVATTVGDSYRYEWKKGDDRFGFEGELVESLPPFREVTTERMIGMPGQGTLNEMTLVPIGGGTLLSLLLTYPSLELRDIALTNGMIGGLESSYRRLETEVLSQAGVEAS